ncbi:hypothetical protein HSB1_39830 [Halogranum salarium B-1]|uniref:Uncharacterized protein n=1 Tax=Halogranum salarium B-1 TaxID=1210908 RepID=J3ETT2_9EURY|nr:hypothetical protein HSB1_39830 [Halogranum salarium B-1]
MCHSRGFTDCPVATVRIEQETVHCLFVPDERISTDQQ